jgi:hypothetical protein
VTNIPDKICRENHDIQLMFKKLLPINPAVREKMCHNIVQRKGPQMAIQQGKKGVDLRAV